MALRYSYNNEIEWCCNVRDNIKKLWYFQKVKDYHSFKFQCHHFYLLFLQAQIRTKLYLVFPTRTCECSSKKTDCECSSKKAAMKYQVHVDTNI